MPIFCSSSEFDSLCREISGRAEIVRLQVKGGSMYPFIRSGDRVTVALHKNEKEDVKIGDVILFRKEDSLYMHRVIRKTRNGFIAKGDMSFGHDGIIVMKDMVGRVVSVERSGRSIDLSRGVNRFVAVGIAGASLLLQYPLLFIEKMRYLGMAIFSRIQGLAFYRRIAKKMIPADIVIRQAVPGDSEEIRDIFTMGGHDIKKDILDIKEKGFWLVAERKKKIVAALTITQAESNPCIWMIFGLEVKLLFRGLGIARKIVTEAVAKARECGAKEIGLFVNKKSGPAIKLYRGIGFKETREFPSEFKCDEEELCLSYEVSENSFTTL